MAQNMEMLDIVDENGMPTGEVVSRKKAHAEGIRHRTAHVWLVRSRDGKIQILLQKRCQQKDSWPGCYDISSAGHIPAGVDFIPSALRELKEELGVEAAPEELLFCGNRLICSDSAASPSGTGSIPGFSSFGATRRKRTLCSKRKKSTRSAGWIWRNAWKQLKTAPSPTASTRRSWKWSKRRPRFPCRIRQRRPRRFRGPIW